MGAGHHLMESGGKQRLAAILAADVVGYSRLMTADERATVVALDAARLIFRAQIESSQGRVIDMAGDSVLAVFDSVTGAVSAALAVQQTLEAAARAVPEGRRMRFRIGVHLGDVIERPDGSVYGDGVNMAARLEGLAAPGGITVSDAVQGAVRNRLAVTFVDLGEREVKNMASLRAYEVKVASPPPDVGQPAVARRDRPSVAVLPFANMSGDPEQAYFADGISEHIITELSQVPFALRDRAELVVHVPRPRARRAEGGEGPRRPLRAGGERTTGRHRPPGHRAAHRRHERPSRVGGALRPCRSSTCSRSRTRSPGTSSGSIAPGIVMAEIQHSKGKTAAELDSWDRIMRAHWHIRRFTAVDFREACRLLEELLTHEPDQRGRPRRSGILPSFRRHLWLDGLAAGRDGSHRASWRGGRWSPTIRCGGAHIAGDPRFVPRGDTTTRCDDYGARSS